jgi:hypothetical protein
MRYLLILLLLLGCGAPSPTTWQEPVVRIAALPRSQNLIAFGSSIAGIESQAQTLVHIDAVIRGRLPGWRFYIVQWPARVPDGGIGHGPNGYRATTCTSYRDFNQNLIVLSWWGPENIRALQFGTWGFGGVAWEVENAVAGLDDDGRRVR